MNLNHFEVTTQNTDDKTPKQKNRKVYKQPIRYFGMKNNHTQEIERRK